MRNLKIKSVQTYNTALRNSKFIVLDSCGAKKDTIFICTETELYSCNLQTESFDFICDVTGVVSCEYLSLENQICVATETGEVLLINPDTKDSTEVTFCEGGILKMVWSPDQEVVAFVTTTRNVVVMTCTFDPFSEVNLDENQFGENAFISVGWGKKETQFHGSEGKTAAKQKTNFSVPNNINELPQEIDVSWREDGQLFAVTFVGEQGRMFKVFDKEGALKFTSEKLNDLCPPIAWRPSGNWIAIPHKFPNKSTIALFEKNGLRHREIVLPFQFDSEPVVSLKWNASSDILAIETLAEGKSVLYFYTIGNYHWYLKQTLRFESTLATYVWDIRIGEEKTMHVILSDGTLASYRWSYKIDRSQCFSKNPDFKDRALVGVIDGKRILITDFYKAIVPPPMSSFEFVCDDYINEFVFLNDPESDGIYFLINNAQNNLLLYSLSKTNEINPFGEFSLKPTIVPLSHHNFVWPTLKNVYFVQATGLKSKILTFETLEKKDKTIKELNGVICGLESLDPYNILAQVTDGKILKIICSTNNQESNVFCDPGKLCVNIEYFKRNDSSGVISLDIHQCLRYNTKVLSTDVTSFHITNNYLVFTQLTAMKFIRLSDWELVNERKIERGGKIITILPYGSLTILQLPRGNLEAIHPRVLCLEMVGDLLDKKQYHQAMNLTRKQRINLNIICDHDLTKFLLHLKEFLEDINAERLNLFLADLQNEDFSLTMYSSNYSNATRNYPEGFRIENKIAHICEAICKEIYATNSQTSFLLPIITAHVKMGNVEKALEIIWEVRKEKGDKTADDALKYLLYLVDVNQLYDVALGMYDFGLVLMVAKRSQKDPREFLPFLNELKDLEENYRKFKIDVYLKRFAKALGHISLCGESRFEEALSLVKTHNLYRYALSAYKENAECYKKIAEAYGDYLRENGKFENASLMYERAGLLSQALTCARHVLDWQRCLTLSKMEGIFPQKTAMSLVPLLMEHGRHEDAFELIKKYGDHFTEQILCLLKGHLYLKAIFECKLENTELLESIIKPDLLSYKETLAFNLNADKDLFLKQKSRLLAIREKKSKENASDDLDDSGQIDESDLLSDTTSMHSSRYTASSRGTGKTFRSSKNRRKHERKLLSLKEGNPFEDIALIDALYNHIIKVFGLQAHIRDTCKALLEISEDDHAREIQNQYRALLLLLKDSFDEIWSPEVMTTTQYVTGPNFDYAALQNEQRYAMIKPLKRFKPEPNIIDWQNEILK